MNKAWTLLIIVVAFIAGLIADFAARTALDNAILLSDMDAAGHKILNLPNDQPLPPVNVQDGSITDAKVSATAAIAQSKLALTGAIPPSFLGTTSTTAAEGDLAEYVANKGAVSGYAALDSTGKIPTSELPASAGTGTVTSVGVATANGISATGGPITTSGSFTFSLGAITPTSSIISGTAGAGFIGLVPQTSNPAVTANLRIWANSVGSLSLANNVATAGHTISIRADTITADRAYQLPDESSMLTTQLDLPTVMVGLGPSHKSGLVPDPTASTGSASDYLGRDAAWHTFSGPPSYQPAVTQPNLGASSNTTGPRNITITSTFAGANLFYVIDNTAGPFIYYGGGTVSLPNGGHTIYAYAAASGFSNSAFSTYTNSNP